MSNKTPQVPKRLEILPHCSIDGVREGRRLYAGMYRLGENMSADEARILATPEFAHCVRILSDKPPKEKLALDGDLPTATPGYQYSRQKAHEQELAAWERDHGKSVRKPERLQDSE